MRDEPVRQCHHTCKELCTALELAIEQEKRSIVLYGSYRDECTYPDVKIMLNELILQRQRSIRLLEETKQVLATKFQVLDQIREGFEMS